MSEEEEIETSEDDYSVSEEEWNPNSTQSNSSDSDFTDSKDEKTPPAKFKKVTTKTGSRKTFSTKVSNKCLSGSIKEILERAKANKVKSLSISQSKDSETKITFNDESSSSSDDLVDPKNLDLDSSFYKTKISLEIKTGSRTPTPNFDCNAGISILSESDEDKSENDDEKEESHKSNTLLPFSNLAKFAHNLNEAKEKLKNYKQSGSQSVVDVSNLLALGEKTNNSNKSPEKTQKRVLSQDSESDWEEVEEHTEEQGNEGLKIDDNIQITLDLSGDKKPKDKYQSEIEKAIKQQINRERREAQLKLHTQSVKDWIDQGNYINSTLNTTSLYQLTLKLLPSTHAYPKDKADLKYFEQITKWFKSVIKISSDEFHPKLSHDIDLKKSISDEIAQRTVVCKRDFVLIFIILLRAIGIDCRLAINLVTPPIRPAQSDLCRITDKPKEESVKKQVAKSKKKKVEDTSDDEFYDDIVSKLSEKKPPTKKNKQEIKDKEPSKTQSSSNSNSKSAKRRKESTSTPVKTEEHKTKVNIFPENDEKFTTSPKKIIKDTPKEKVTRLRSRKKLEPENSTKSTNSKSKTRASSTKPNKKSNENAEVPQLDGMDEIPVPRMTRSRSKTPTNLNKTKASVKPTLLCKKDEDSPILAKTLNKNNCPKLIAPESKQKNQVPASQSSSENFEVKKDQKSFKRNKNIKLRSTGPSTSKLQPTKRKTVDSEDDVFEKSMKQKPAKVPKTIDRRVLSSDEDGKKKKDSTAKNDFWVEVWLEKEEKWVSIDAFKPKVDCLDLIKKSTTNPIAYVLVWNGDCTIKDVSARYCQQWHSITRKLRVEPEVLDNMLKPFIGKKPTNKDKKEDSDLNRMRLDLPMPNTISEFKNHPLYALKRHLLKFEAIYPPDAPTMGFIRGEPIYARECVHQLHSREIWVKQAKVVKLGETPYKIVTARPKWDRATNSVIKDIPLEIFGPWQTKDYEPPIAENGIVPRNAYGNVELFKECMLPINTVHLPYSGLNRVCKKLKIDCAPAVVGFDFHGGWSHPVFEGFVVCKEFAEIVTDAWIKEEEEATRKAEEKYKERVYGNWKKLIKGLLIKKRLQNKYNFKETEEEP